MPGKQRIDGVPLVEPGGERFASVVLAVCEDRLRSVSSERLDPPEEVRLASMRAETVQGVDSCLDSDVLAEDPHALCPLDELAAQGPVRLKANNKDVRFRAPEIVFQVVQDSSSCAHPRTRHDETRTADSVQAT